MTTPHPLRLARAIPRAFATLFFFGFAALFAAAADGRVAFDVPAGEAGQTLKRFAQQAKREILFPVQPVGNVTTNPVRGEFSVREALDRLLAGTELSAFEDAKTGAIVVKREPAPNAPSRRAIDAAAAENNSATAVRVENGAVKLDDYAVTGSRIRRDPTELGASPVQVFDRKAIERSGAISMSDFTRQITQNANDLTGLNSNGGPLGARTTINLRGLGQGTTLVLLNGRRMPRSGQAFNIDDYDLSGIPLASIERVEVLTDGASAIYGADAIGGVVNIITRRDYNGSELSLQYGNSFASDAAERAVTLSTGFADGKQSASLSVNYSSRNSFGNDARSYTATSDFSASGGRDGRDTFGGGGAGYVIGDFLPGLSTSDASIPPGQNGVGLTPAAFIPFAGQIIPFDAALYGDSLDATMSWGAMGDWSYDFRRWLSVYANVNHSRSRTTTRGAPPNAPEIFVPEDNPFNPFGVDLIVSKYFYELGRSHFVYDTRNENYTLGFTGELGETWRYDASYSKTRLISDAYSPVADVISPTTIEPLVAGTNPATTLNVFGDGRIGLPAAHIALLQRALGEFTYRTDAQNDIFDVHADGVLWRGPTGEVRLALGGEKREESVLHQSRNTTAKTFAQLTVASTRRTASGFGELHVPLIKRDAARPLLKALSLQLAGRFDDTEGFKENFSPKVSGIWQPFSSVRVRASVGEGFKTPNLYILALPTTVRNTRYTAFNNIVDRARNNELVVGTLSVATGGNPNLRPETSKSRSLGVIYEPDFIAGLSISADFYDIRYVDRVISSLREQDIIDFFPGRFTRAATVNGVPGRIISFDRRASNLDSSRAEGADFKIAYQRETGVGRWTYSASATRATHLSLRSAPSSPINERVGRLGSPKWRATASVVWERGRAEAGASWRYVGSTQNVLPVPPTAEAASEFDLHVGYRFAPVAANASRVRSLLGGTKLNVGIENVLDTVPPSINGDGGYVVMDPRQRRYWVSLGKQF